MPGTWKNYHYPALWSSTVINERGSKICKFLFPVIILLVPFNIKSLDN